MRLQRKGSVLLRYFFVESDIVTVPHVKNRIHAFGRGEDAMKHLEKFNGRRVENPFH